MNEYSISLRDALGNKLGFVIIISPIYLSKNVLPLGKCLTAELLRPIAKPCFLIRKPRKSLFLIFRLSEFKHPHATP